MCETSFEMLLTKFDLTKLTLALLDNSRSWPTKKLLIPNCADGFYPCFRWSHDSLRWMGDFVWSPFGICHKNMQQNNRLKGGWVVGLLSEQIYTSCKECSANLKERTVPKVWDTRNLAEKGNYLWGLSYKKVRFKRPKVSAVRTIDTI